MPKFEVSVEDLTTREESIITVDALDEIDMRQKVNGDGKHVRSFAVSDSGVKKAMTEADKNEAASDRVEKEGEVAVAKALDEAETAAEKKKDAAEKKSDKDAKKDEKKAEKKAEKKDNDNS
jgi:hypothetical protein